MRYRIPLLLAAMIALCASRAGAQERWTPARAQTWQRTHSWLIGANYIPRTAINQLEMWQADTFDPTIIDQELGWAHDIGFNSARVFLHDLLWQQDSVGFLSRMDRFLAIASTHRIGVMFVLLDGVWNPEPKLGLQPAPIPHRHNSGWMQSPGAAIRTDIAAAHRRCLVGRLERHVETRAHSAILARQFRHHLVPSVRRQRRDAEEYRAIAIIGSADDLHRVYGAYATEHVRCSASGAGRIARWRDQLGICVGQDEHHLPVGLRHQAVS